MEVLNRCDVIASALLKGGRTYWESDNGGLGCSHREIEEFKIGRGVRKASSRVTDPGLQASRVQLVWAAGTRQH